MAVAATEKSRSFEPRRERDVLTKALGNLEHRDCVHGISSRQRLKTVESWKSNMSLYHMRQAYKEGLAQKGRDDVVKDMIIGSIQDAFTSNDPKMVELRSHLFR